MIDTKALREKILDLAIRGKLVPQDPNDEPASVLLEHIRTQKQQMVREGKLKPKDIKNDSIIFKGKDNLYYEQFQDGTVKCIEDEIPFELPAGWAWTRVGTISSAIQYGLSTSAKSQGSHKLLRITDIQNGYVDWDTVPFTSIDNPDNYILKTGDIVFARTGATVGKSFLITDLPYPAVYASYLIRIRLLDNLLPDYVYLFFDSICYWNQITDKSVGVGQPNCNGTSLKELLVPLPPLEEQLKIITTTQLLLNYVNKIRIEKAKLLNIISDAKSKILDLAIRGNLVSQDPNDEPASVLLERIRAEKEELIKQGKIKQDKKESVILKGNDNSYYHNIPKNWEITTLRRITTPLTLNDGDWILSENMNAKGEVKLLQLGSIGNMIYIDKGFKYLTKQTFDELSCTEIFPKYLLINRIISDKMCCCIIPNIEGTIITTVDTCWIAPLPRAYNLKFLMYELASPVFQNMVLMKATGTTRKRISKNNLIDLPLLFPPLAEQKRIAQAIEIAFVQLDHIINCTS